MHISNADLRSEILHYQYELRCWESKVRAHPRSRCLKPRPSEQLGTMILELCRKLATRSNFVGYSFRDDLVSAATLDCLAACERFDPVTRTSAFAYLTTTAWRRMAKMIVREGRHSQIKELMRR